MELASRKNRKFSFGKVANWRDLIPMQKKFLWFTLTTIALLCGCEKQARLNSQKIMVLSSNIVQLEQNQSRQMASLQTQLASLGPMLDKMNGSYFEKTHEDAFFYHTNTLYLLLTVGRKIEADLQAADTQQQAEHLLAYEYHTNQLHTLYLCVAQLEETLAGQATNIQENVNAETRKLGAALRDELQVQLAAANATAAARLKQMEADVAQMKRDLEQIKLQPGQFTNPPATRP